MADTNIKYSDHSISSAFKDHYIVPDYQREYVWTNDQVEQLLSDLLEAFEEDTVATVLALSSPAIREANSN